MPLSFAVSPAGHVYLYDNPEETWDATLNERLTTCFAGDVYYGLLYLAGMPLHAGLSPLFAFWQGYARLFITKLCHQSVQSESMAVIALQPPDEAVLTRLLNEAPFMRGGEYLNREVLYNTWRALHGALAQAVSSAGTVSAFLESLEDNWSLLGRIYFHLAENKRNTDKPFAFLATYTGQLSQQGDAQHLPLERALKEYANDKQALLSLLLPLQKAGKSSPFIQTLVDTQRIFHPMAWSATEAYHFLQEVSCCEAAGILVRIPDWWKAERPPRARVKASIGKDNAVSMGGLDAILSFDIQVALDDGTVLTEAEIREILVGDDNLVNIKGQWTEVDRVKLKEVLAHWKKLQRQARDEGITLAQGLRLLASGGNAETAEAIGLPSVVAQWSHVVAGDWLASTLRQLREPETQHHAHLADILSSHLKATLRPYQWHGAQWLWLLYQLRLGGCLADDMGLGKTIQVIALFLLIKHQTLPHKPHLLIVPSSLLGNWQAEFARFAPGLRIWAAHSSAETVEALKNPSHDQLADIDVVITTYALTYRLPWLLTNAWHCAILDEAQCIKNPIAKQTRAIKTIQSVVRFTLTGTPIENRLSDLWSLFDFNSPGLLGSAKNFSRYQKASMQKDTKGNGFGLFCSTLRQLVRPYILRRLKSDKQVINDLPDKVEVPSFCSLTKQQVTLYQQAIEEFKQQLFEAEGIKRKGLVLNYLLRFKQICNHPSQWLGYDTYEHTASGKFIRLIELCEVIAAKQEKVLVFTQFTEIIPALMACLSSVFKQEGLMLDGKTPLKTRKKRVDAFQTEQGPPFFVLSLKAGGTGLTLTHAAHVIHFDRWWNPAVENQATDRAYRIGQRKNVMVHKFICQGTVEEKIDELIHNKKALSHDILANEPHEEVRLTELSNEALLNVVALDIHRAFADN